MPDTPDDQPQGGTRSRSTSLTDPRQIRLVNRLRSGSTGSPIKPQPIGKGMQRKIDLEEKKFQERQTARKNPPQGEGPKDDSPKDDVPKSDVPKTDVPKTDVPQDVQQKPVPTPQPPKLPEKLVLKSNLASALEQIHQAANTAQESMRAVFGELTQARAQFVDLQEARKGGQDVSSAMSHMIDGARSTLAVCDHEVTRLRQLASQLGDLDTSDPHIPPAVLARHQQLTQELRDRVTRAERMAREATTLVQLMYAARADAKDNINATAGLTDYAPATYELVTMLKAGHKRFEELTVNARHEGGELTATLQHLQGWMQLVASGKSTQLPPAPEVFRVLDEADTLAAAKAKTFGKWNASLQRTWKPLDFQASKVTPPDTEITLWRERGSQAYNDYIRAYSEADETAKSITHIVTQLRAHRSPSPGTLPEAKTDLEKLLADLGKQQTRMSDPIGRIKGAKDKVSELKSAVKSTDPTQLGSINATRTQVMGTIEKLSANMLALERALQETAVAEQALKTRYPNDPSLKSKISDGNKLCSQLHKLIESPLSDARKTLAALQELKDQIDEMRARLGKEASPDDTKHLVDSLASLPPSPGRDTLFPGDEGKQAHSQLGKGGDKKAASLFGDVTTAWEAVEKSKSGDLNKVRKLEAAANAYLKYHTGAKLSDQVDTDRAQRCTEALRKARHLLQAQALKDLPPPPWTEEQATEARRLDASIRLNNGEPAKPPSGKGESDSFFLKGSDGKPSFIFKPQEGESVKEGAKPGGGVVREVLTSKFNDQIKNMIGLDFGVSPTQLVTLESDSFAEGTNSQATVRTGALQQAIDNEGSLKDVCGSDGDVGKNLPVEDVQKIALMDFLTLQADRNADNVLIQDVGGHKRLVPIDGGFAFPSKEMFSAYSTSMLGDGKGGQKDGTVDMSQGAALMQLPQSDLPFTPEMLAAIDKIDPDALAKGMKAANKEIGESEPGLKDLVNDENIEMMRRSALLLKKAAPLFTVAQLSQMYAEDMNSLLDVPDKQLEGAIQKLIERGKDRAAFKAAWAEDTEAFEKLGGNDGLIKLGWSPSEGRLKRDLKRRIEILQKQERPQPSTPSDSKADTDKTDDQIYAELGGDKLLLKVLARPDGTYLIKNLGPQSPVKQKIGRLLAWKIYNDGGGDRGYAALIELYKASQYTRFDKLDVNGRAAVMAMDSTQSPLTTHLGIKSDCMKTFMANGGKL